MIRVDILSLIVSSPVLLLETSVTVVRGHDRMRIPFFLLESHVPSLYDVKFPKNL